jgi:hypothetical protein
LFASNELFVVAVDAQDRRFFCLETDNKYSGIQTVESKKYFDAILNVPVELFAHYLYTYDTSKFNARNIPMTSLKREQKNFNNGW